MERKLVVHKVNELLDTFCQDCFLNKYLRQTYGKNHAQRFCIQQCSVGDELKTYGKMLVRRDS